MVTKPILPQGFSLGFRGSVVPTSDVMNGEGRNWNEAVHETSYFRLQTFQAYCCKIIVIIVSDDGFIESELCIEVFYG
jgi:hypothetical protein